MNQSTELPQSKHIVVIGAGIAGLSAVNAIVTAQESKPNIRTRVTLIESGSRMGGRIESATVAGQMVELGAAFALDATQFGVQCAPAIADPDRAVALVINGAVHAAATVEECVEVALGRDEIFEPLFAFSALFGSSLLTLSAPQTTSAPSAFGNAALLPPKLSQAVDAFFRIIHPGKIQEYIASIQSTALTNWPCSTNALGNGAIIEALFEKLQPHMRLLTQTRATSVTDHGNGVSVQVSQGDRVWQEHADAVVIATTVPGMRAIMPNLRGARARFYEQVRYAPGIVVALDSTRPLKSLRLAVAVNEPWSSVIFTAPTADGCCAAQVYLSSDAAISAWSQPDAQLIQTVTESLQRLGLLGDCTAGVVRRWRHLGPVITPAMSAAWIANHHQLSSRIYFGGEVAAFTPKYPVSFGVQSAWQAGRDAATQLMHSLSAPSGTDTSATVASNAPAAYPPLITADVYALQANQPRYLESRIEGDVAFYGLINSANPTPALTDYLWRSQSQDKLWEYGRGFGSTLEDTCLVMEGLLSDTSQLNRLCNSAAKLPERFQDEHSGAFHTTRNGRSKYWRLPSVDGTAWACWLLSKLNNFRWMHSVNLGANWLWSQREGDGLWRGTWFQQRELTDFLVLRLLHLEQPTDPRLLDALSRAMARQAWNGSWSGGVIATSTRLLTLFELRDCAGPSALVTTEQLHSAVRRGLDWLDQSRTGTSWAGEPVLYYWYETGEGMTEGERLFFHCRDSGAVTSAWATRALDAWQGNL